MEKDSGIKFNDCIDFMHKMIDMTKRNELIWVNINTLVENYDLGGLINESTNGVMKYKTKFNEINIILSSAYWKLEKRFNLEFFPEGDLVFYRMPYINEKEIVRYFEELEEFVMQQIKKHDIEKITKIMGI